VDSSPSGVGLACAGSEPFKLSCLFRLCRLVEEVPVAAPSPGPAGTCVVVAMGEPPLALFFFEVMLGAATNSESDVGPLAALAWSIPSESRGAALLEGSGWAA
jgi:hypothetical protein